MAKHLPTYNSPIDDLRPFAQIRLLAVDLDGTLLHSKNDELNDFIEILSRALRSQATKLTLATGRTLTGIHDVMKRLSLPKGVPLILYNGSVIVENGSFDVLFKRTISSTSLSIIIDIVLDHDGYALAYAFDPPPISRTKQSGWQENVLGWSDIERPDYEFNGMKVQWISDESGTENFEPSAILIGGEKTAPHIKEIMQRIITRVPDVDITSSGGGYIEIRPKGSNKGVALQAIARIKGYSLNEILALGDNDNDIEMLDVAGISVCVSGASEKAISHSDYISKYDATEGAVEVLRLVKQAKRYKSVLLKSVND